MLIPSFNQTLNSNQSQVDLIYIKSLCDIKKIQEVIVNSFFEMDDIHSFEAYLKSIEGYSTYKSDQEALEKLYRDHIAVILNIIMSYYLRLKTIQTNPYWTLVQKRLLKDRKQFALSERFI